MTTSDPVLNEVTSPTAAFKLTVGSLEATQQDPKGVDSIVVETNLDMIGICKIQIHGESIKPSDFKVGDDVTFEMGRNEIKTFQGNITSVKHNTKAGKEHIAIVAMDPLVKMSNSHQTQTWGGSTTDKVKDSDLASKVISDSGCSAGTVDSTTGERPYILQRAESNLAFLKRLAARNGYLVYAEEGKIHFKKPQFSEAPIEISSGDLIDTDVQRTDLQIPKKVIVHGWDYVRKTEITGECDTSAIDKIGSGALPDPQTYGDDLHISDVFVDSDASAKAMAEGEMNRLARGLVRGTITVNGNGKLIPGKKVKMVGNWSSFNAEVLIAGARHVIEPGSVAQTTVWVVGNTEPE